MKADRTLVANYAGAVFSVALKSGAEKQVAADALAISEAFRGNKKLRAFFESPNIPRDAKESILEKLIGRFHPVLLNFGKMVIRRGRIEVFGPVLTELQDLYRRHVGQFAGTVVSAVPLADDQKATLLKSLSKATGHQLEIHWIVDPSVLGGLRFLSGDTLIDTTLAHKLDRLRTELRGAQVV